MVFGFFSRLRRSSSSQSSGYYGAKVWRVDGIHSITSTLWVCRNAVVRRACVGAAGKSSHQDDLEGTGSRWSQDLVDVTLCCQRLISQQRGESCGDLDCIFLPTPLTLGPPHRFRWHYTWLSLAKIVRLYTPHSFAPIWGVTHKTEIHRWRGLVAISRCVPPQGETDWLHLSLLRRWIGCMDRASIWSSRLKIKRNDQQIKVFWL